LDFVAVGQMSETQSVNGSTTATNSTFYKVIPQRVGLYTIPAPTAASQPLVLRVGPGSSATGSALSDSSAAALPAVSAIGLVAGAARMTPDGSAFVRVAVPKHRLYVGESTPVEIQVGVRRGMVASLNGPPSLNGDAFTLNKLASQPAQVEEIINGNPFTVFTWRSVLAAVKPGALSLTMETPITVRMQTGGIAPRDMPGGSSLGDIFNDPLFQNFFGGTSEKDITVSSAPVEFNVLALPTQDRPASFTGAVGTFTVRSELSATTVTAGDPVTLRMQVTGTGNFDRVNSTMLGSLDHWKTYQPTARFDPADSGGYRGEKVFEQPLIATESGAQTLPGVAFSYFDPDAQRFETVQTPGLSVAVAPAAAGSGVASAMASAAPPDSGAVAALPAATPQVGLRPDHVPTGAVLSSLVPPYFRPRFLTLPFAISLAFAGSWLWMRRPAGHPVNSAGAVEKQLERMRRAAAAGDVPLFLDSARAAMRQGSTAEDIDSRALLALADEARYSGFPPDRIDFQKWTRTVQRALKERATA
jgi:hypothetical protein